MSAKLSQSNNRLDAVLATRTDVLLAGNAIDAARAVVTTLETENLKLQSDLDLIVTQHLRDAEKSILSGEDAPDRPERGRKVERLKEKIAAYPGAIAAAKVDVKAKQDALKPLEFAFVDAVLTFATGIRNEAAKEISDGLAALAPAFARMAGVDMAQTNLIGTKFSFDSQRHAGFFMGGPMIKPLFDKLPARFRPDNLRDAEFAAACTNFAAETVSTISGNS